MPPSMRIKNQQDLVDAFKRCDQLTQAKYLKAAVTAGLQPIANRNLELVPRVTSTLARSYHWEIIEATEGYCEGVYGTNLDYARRVELGFEGTDSLGRTYNQPAQSHLRPAFDTQRKTAVEEIRDSLADILTRLVV